MTKKRILMLIGTVCLALMLAVPLVASCAPATPEEAIEAEYTWRAGTSEVEPLRNPSIALFCDLIEVYSEGRIEIEWFPDGLLGGHDEIFHALQEGSIEIGHANPYVSLCSGGMLNWMPWSIGTYEEAAIAYSVPDGILYQVMTDAWEEVGARLLWSCPAGPYGIGNNVRPLKTPDDFKDLKMRVSGSLGFVMALENMAAGSGMTVETIPWNDLYGALERGVVDGCWSLWVDMVSSRHMEVLEYYTALDWSFDCGNILMNQELWESLPADLQDAIVRASHMAEERDYEAHRRATMGCKKQVADAGVEIYYPTPEERALFREKANMAAVWEELCVPWLEERYPGQNMAERILDELDRIAKATAAGGV